jgi:hypothetical protein
MTKTIKGYAVYANGYHEGDARTLAGARAKARAVARAGLRPSIAALWADGDRSWIEYLPEAS